MEKEIKKISETKIEIKFVFAWGEFKDYYEQALSKLNQGITLDGFRPGKAPKEVAEQKFGEARILEDAVDLILKDKYPAFVIENNLEVIGQPKVEILKLARGNDFECKVIAEVLPEIKLPDYAKIAQGVKKTEVVVEEKDLTEALEWIKKSRASFEDLDRPAQKEDMVEVNYHSPQIENGKNFEDKFFLSQGKLVPGFEEKIEGMKAGEEKEFEITFPSDYFKPELAGQTVTFNLKVEKVQKANYPELNDELAKTLGDFENLDALKKNVMEGIQQEKGQESNQKRREEILDKIIQQSELAIPETLLTQEKARIIHQLEHDVQEQLGLSWEEYANQNFKDEKELNEKMHKQAVDRIKSYLIVRAIGEKEQVEVSDIEIEQACQEFLSRYAKKPAVEKEIDLERLKGYYKGVIFNDKVFQKLDSF
ncbi:MAG: trigger factor [Candidatus Gribaldobacteria bacterium]|nr:trigger factor [Candidatus Gribaldobacteria bacterium]